MDQISFNSLKENALSGEGLEIKGTVQPSLELAGSLSYQEAVGKASTQVSIAGHSLDWEWSASLHRLNTW